MQQVVPDESSERHSSSNSALSLPSCHEARQDDNISLLIHRMFPQQKLSFDFNKTISNYSQLRQPSETSVNPITKYLQLKSLQRQPL